MQCEIQNMGKAPVKKNQYRKFILIVAYTYTYTVMGILLANCSPSLIKNDKLMKIVVSIRLLILGNDYFLITFDLIYHIDLNGIIV